MSGDHHYPEGTVRAVLDTDLLTAPTARALRQRLGPVEPHFHLLGEEGAAMLRAICDRLIPQPDRADPIDIAIWLHAQVATGGGDGWRYAVLPGDAAALIAGVAGVDASARLLAGRSFLELDDATRDGVLSAVQRGDPPGDAWTTLPAARWFEELLVAVTEIYYGHPVAQEEIGFLGMADAPGWPDVGLGARAVYEPVELDRG